MDYLIDPYRRAPAGCNSGHTVPEYFYAADIDAGYPNDPPYFQPSDALITASLSYAKRAAFLSSVAARGMVFSEETFTGRTVAATFSVPVNLTATGSFTLNFTAQSGLFASALDTVPITEDIETSVRNFINSGRFNVSPLGQVFPAARWLHFTGNTGNFILASPVTAVGFYTTDADDFLAEALDYNPWQVTYQTTMGELVLDENTVGMQVQSPVQGAKHLNFYGLIMPTGHTISSFRIRWHDYTGDSDFWDRLGIDGVLFARCPV